MRGLHFDYTSTPASPRLPVIGHQNPDHIPQSLRAGHSLSDKSVITCTLVTVCSVLFLFLSVCSSPVHSATPEPPQKPPAYVVDLAGVITEEGKAKLNVYLKELEQKTTAQIVILTIQSLDGEDIARFSLRTAERWKLGQKGKDNGVIIAVAVKDRKYRFEIGYGLESILPDSLVGSLGREYLVPNFRKGDYSSGIFDVTVVIIRTIASHEGVEITGVSQ